MDVGGVEEGRDALGRDDEGRDEGGEEDRGCEDNGGKVTAVPSRPMISGLFGVAAEDRRWWGTCWTGGDDAMCGVDVVERGEKVR